jgi:hypothetical protein
VVSKPQIRFKRTRARRRPIEKVVCPSIHGYVSIYRRPATQPLGLRWGFETTSSQYQGGSRDMFESGDLRKGLKLELDGEPYVIVI